MNSMPLDYLKKEIKYLLKKTVKGKSYFDYSFFKTLKPQQKVKHQNLLLSLKYCQDMQNKLKLDPHNQQYIKEYQTNVKLINQIIVGNIFTEHKQLNNQLEITPFLIKIKKLNIMFDSSLEFELLQNYKTSKVINEITEFRIEKMALCLDAFLIEENLKEKILLSCIEYEKQMIKQASDIFMNMFLDKDGLKYLDDFLIKREKMKLENQLDKSLNNVINHNHEKTKIKL